MGNYHARFGEEGESGNTPLDLNRFLHILLLINFNQLNDSWINPNAQAIQLI